MPQINNPISFNNLFSNLKFREGNISTLIEFNKNLFNGTILFYPSSGIDVNDLLYIREDRIDSKKFIEPNVFIHSDFMYNADYNVPFEFSVRHPNFNIKSFYKFFYSEMQNKDEPKIELYKLEVPNSDKIKWLIFFRGFYNEDILKEIIQKKLNISFVYAVCDGMGMSNIDKSIPTIFYPFFVDSIGLKIIVTEQNFLQIKHYINTTEILILRMNLKNILKLSVNEKIVEMLNLDDEKLKDALLDFLGNIKEKKINDQHLKVFDSRFSEELVLKELY